MTSEEKQEIINAVLAAIRTNSKSIDQLTPVSEMSDTDFLELNGGRKVSYGVLFANHMSNDEAQESWEYLDTKKVDKDLRGLVEVHQAPVVFLDAMGILDGHSLNGGEGLEYRPDYKQIFDFPNGLFGAPKAGAVYISKNNFKKFVWNGTDLEELKADECPLFVDYSEPVAFATLPVGGSYYVPSSHKIAVKIDASNTKTYDPLPDALYFFRDKGMIYTWKSSTNKWVPAGSDIKVVNNLTAGGEGDALSAEMGKVIKRNIMMLWAALGNYAFPGDKPTLDWGGGGTTTCSVTQTLGTHVVSDYQGSSVNLGDSLTVRLSSSDDLYVINPSSVKVKVGGVDMASTYYNENTDIITIPTVVDNVVIEANAMTYVQDDLVLHLDCRHRGGTGTVVSGHWKSLVNYGQSPIDFTLKSGVTAADTGVVFDGDTDAYGETNTALALAFAECTVEAVASGINSQFNPILVNPGEMVVGISIHTVSATGDRTATLAMSPNGIDDYQGSCAGKVGNNTTDFALSLNVNRGYNKGIPFDVNEKRNLLTDSATQTKLTLGARFRGSGNNFLNGTVRAIRVYHSVLTAEQQLQNWIVDKKRFNL